MATTMLEKIKLALRTSHSKLDSDIEADIEACLMDLERVGVVYAETSDPLIFNAVKLYCKSLYTDDPAKGSEFLRRYEKLRDSLAMSEGYGYEDEEESADE